MTTIPPVVTFPPQDPTTSQTLAGSANFLVINVGGSSTISSPNIVTVGQLQLALAASGLNSTIYQALSADVNDPTWVQYNSGTTCTLGDALSNKIKTVLSYSDSAIAALFAAAKLQSL